MSTSSLLERLSEERIIAILRGVPAEAGEAVVEALAEGGIVFLEFTLNSPSALELIARCRKQYEGRLLVGAGTVLDLRMAQEAVTAGAQYLISPNVDEEVIRYGTSQGVEVWPGALTPTEIVRAHRAGASAVKLFPYASMGASYLREIRAPLDHIPLIATGGIKLGNLNEALQAGAVAVGAGGQLVDKELIRQRRFRELSHHANQFVQESKESSLSDA